MLGKNIRTLTGNEKEKDNIQKSTRHEEANDVPGDIEMQEQGTVEGMDQEATFSESFFIHKFSV